MRLLRRLLPVAVLLALLVWGFLPKPVEVRVGAVSTGPLRVTVDEDGRTRVRDRFDVAAPAGGRLDRITLKVGDSVAADQVVAVIRPAPSAPLDPRVEEQARARLQAVEAQLAQADATVGIARADLALASNRFVRVESMARAGTATPDDLDAARHAFAAAQAGLAAAEHARTAAGFERDAARAALTPPGAAAAGAALEVRSPVAGRVLALPRESETVVAPGQPLLSIGDPSRLEIEVDVLSADAVDIAPGAAVSVEHWGGAEALSGTVRRVEPGAFTKLSALGVEEQRVNVIVDLPSAPAGLGDGYRVETRITRWESPNAVRVPLAALFRQGENWAVFSFADGRAVAKPVRIGPRNAEFAQVLDGLRAGDTVLLHPSDRVTHGGRVRLRAQ